MAWRSSASIDSGGVMMRLVSAQAPAPRRRIATAKRVERSVMVSPLAQREGEGDLMRHRVHPGEHHGTGGRHEEAREPNAERAHPRQEELLAVGAAHAVLHPSAIAQLQIGEPQ